MLSVVKNYFNPRKVDVVAEEWAAKNSMTPDIWRLEQYIRQLLFVSDDMKAGGKQHAIVEEASIGPKFMGCYTHDEYTFWRKDLGENSYPIALSKDFKPDAFLKYPLEPARIKGELYAIRPRQFILLDKMRQNGIQFERRRVKITLPYREVSYNRLRPNPKISNYYFHTITAWMYVGITEYWEPQMGGVFCQPVDLYEHDTKRVWIDKFYKFE